MSDTDKKHIPMLQVVADEDVRFVKEKDASYGSSWKQRGGVGAFMMLARKWDRIENILGRNIMTIDKMLPQYDIFAWINDDMSGKDGSILAEVRDLRRYLLLVEAEMLARMTKENFREPLLNVTVENDNWTGRTVRFVPSATGLAGKVAQMEGQVVTDISGWLKIQCGPGLDALYNEPKSVCLLYTPPVLQHIDTDMSQRLVPCDAPAEDSNKHAEREYRDEFVFIPTALGHRLLITTDTWKRLSPAVQMRYVVTGDNAQLDRNQILSEILSEVDLPRYPKFYHQEEIRGLPDWVMEMYQVGIDGYYLKEHFVKLWGK